MPSLFRKLFGVLFKLGLLLALLVAVTAYFAWRHFQAFADAPVGAPEGSTRSV